VLLNETFYGTQRSGKVTGLLVPFYYVGLSTSREKAIKAKGKI
jgi:hypothetical protein